MKAYKGFDKDLKCRGFQYEVGKEYKEDSAKLCEKGFHACENPIDVWGYYPPADSRFCEVELGDVVTENSNDSKVCGRFIKVGAEIGIKGIVDAFLKFTFEKIDWENAAATNTGHQSAATNTGYWSAATVEGKESVAIATGIESKASGALGCYLVLAEWEDKDGWHIKDMKLAKVDGEKIKADTFYQLVGGEFVEVKQ